MPVREALCMPGYFSESPEEAQVTCSGHFNITSGHFLGLASPTSQVPTPAPSITSTSDQTLADTTPLPFRDPQPTTLLYLESITPSDCLGEEGCLVDCFKSAWLVSHASQAQNYRFTAQSKPSLCESECPSMIVQTLPTVSSDFSA